MTQEDKLRAINTICYVMDRSLPVSKLKKEYVELIHNFLQDTDNYDRIANSYSIKSTKALWDECEKRLKETNK